MTDLERIEGLYVGQLNEYESWLFKCAVRDKMAAVDYDHAGGFFLGLGKVKLVRSVSVPRV